MNFFKKMRNLKRIRGKKPPIIIKPQIYNINQIFQYTVAKELCGIGFEYLVFECSSKDKDKLILLGKIIARSSSDFLSMLANKLYSKMDSVEGDSPIHGQKLEVIQYPLSKKDPSRHLIVMVNCTSLIEKEINEYSILAIEELLLNFHRTFRKAMNDIINATLDRYQ